MVSKIHKERQMRKILSLSLFALLVTDATSTMAAKNYSITPILDASVGWNSNYYYSSADEIDVYTYLIQPGISFNYQTARTSTELKATLDGNAYSGSETLDDFIGYTVEFDVNRSTKSNKLTLGLMDQLSYTRDPELLGELENATSRKLYMINTLSPYLQYNLDRFKAGLDYENIITRYDEDASEDTTLHKGSLELLYKMNRTFEFGPRLEVEAMDYDKDSADYQGTDVSAVLVRKGKFLSLRGGIGYHKRTFDDAEDSELDDVSWNLALESQATGFKKTSFKLALTKDMNDSTSYGPGYYSVLQVNGSLERKVGPRLTLGCSASYEKNEYELTDQENDIWQVSATVKYPLTDWLKLELGIGHQTQDSTEDNEDYQNTSGLLKLTFVSK
ncbi:MAG: hypothetical protein D3913_02615 [Candidatus Electrothrix sp. LOE1_4_5]|nr:hypothetical protein [Candidatus Electrothrix gigas]